MKNRAFLAFSAGLLLSVSAAAQHEGHTHTDADQGELGKVSFPVSCSEAAQKEFNRAAAMLHSFWYEESEKTFRQVAAADPQCAMAWWGVAMTQYHPIWYPPTPAELAKGREAVAKAKSIGGATEREKAYIAAIAVFYDASETLDHKTRATAYEKAMEEVSRRFPDDREASAFYAVALLWTLSVDPNDETNPKKAAAILDRIGGEMPRHPGVLHYYIHAYDTPKLAPLALKAARQYAEVAPSVPHALHMPSHIFTRLGLWTDSIESNRASAKSARDYEKRAAMDAAWDQELHALDYMMYAYLQRGDDASAKAVLDRMREVQRAEPVNLSAAYALSAVPVRYVVEGRRWPEAAALELSPAGFPWKKFAIAEGMARYARAMGAIRTGRPAAARAEIEGLQALRDGLKGAQQAFDWGIPVEVLRLEAAGWLAQSEGKTDEALKLLRQAADLEDSTEKHAVTPGSIVPAREQLADLLRESKRPEEALREYEASLRLAPGRFNGLAGAAKAALAAGSAKLARGYYELLVALSDSSSKRPELSEAKTFLGQAVADKASSPK
jgi:tetratricopeptide (TPR) repeat protein